MGRAGKPIDRDGATGNGFQRLLGTGLKSGPDPAAAEVEMSAVSLHTMASPTRAFSGKSQRRTPCLIAIDPDVRLAVVRQQDKPQAVAGVAFPVSDRISGKLSSRHIGRRQAFGHEAGPIAKPMHVDAAAVRFSLRDHHARKLVAIFRSLRESRPDCGQAAKADRREPRLDRTSDATTFCNGGEEAVSAGLTTVNGTFGHRSTLALCECPCRSLRRGDACSRSTLSHALERDDF